MNCKIRKGAVVAYCETIRFSLWNDCINVISLNKGSPSVGRDLNPEFSE